MRLMTLIVSGVILSGFVTEPAWGQVVCNPRAEIAASLLREHAEVPRAMGVTNRGAVLEVFVAPSGTWTLVVTVPSGMSCLTGVGDGWTMLPSPAKGAGS